MRATLDVGFEVCAEHGKRVYADAVSCLAQGFIFVEDD
jgi:hypothetical protein